MRSPRTLWLAAVVVVFGAALAQAAEPAVGTSVFGAEQYVEYIPGELPLILSAPHGGRETPEAIPDWTKGVVEADVNTQELARAVAAEVFARTGHHAHLIICRLHRRKLDCNREVGEAAAGSPIAERAWGEYHGFIRQAAASVTSKYPNGFLIDLHGHSHKDPRLELGYGHSAQELGRPEAELNAPEFAAAGSLRVIAARRKTPYTELLSGPRSLGALLEAEGYRATPSPRMPVPTEPFFRGGYTMREHTGGNSKLAGLQIECNRPGVRDTRENREKFATALVSVLVPYLEENLGLKLGRR